MRREEGYQICTKVLSYSHAEEAEILLEEEKWGLTRFANNQIEQNINTEDLSVSIRSISRQRVGRAWTNILEDESLKEMVRTSEELSRFQPEDRELLPLPGPQSHREMDNFIEATARCGPEERREFLGKILDRCRRESVTAAGILSTKSHALAIANTNGLFAYNQSTEAAFRLSILTEEGAGFASDLNKDIAKLNPERVSQVAIEKALSSRDAKEIEPGEYSVILEPRAVADLIIFLTQLAFGGLAYEEGRSFLSGKLGEKVFSEEMNLSDNVYHPLSQGLPFDLEGMPRREIVLIENGIARNVVHSRKTAKRACVETTGHALPEPNTTGPIPLNPVLSPGKASLEEMITTTDRGVLVTQFHYTNVINPMELTLTGMTRNGTFVIEKGQIAYPIRNMRFTDSLVRIFNQIDSIGKELVRIEGFFGGSAVVPALKIEGLNFSSKTSF